MAIPYLELPAIPLPFGQKVDIFGVLSTAGVFVGAWLGARAARRYGPGDDTPLRDLVPWAVIIGLMGGHWLHIFGYHPELVKNYGAALVSALMLVVPAAVLLRVKFPENPRWALPVDIIAGAMAGYMVAPNDPLKIGLGAVAGGVVWKIALFEIPWASVLLAVVSSYALVLKLTSAVWFSDFLTVIQAWDGLSSMGGVLGALVGIFVFFRRSNLKVLPYADALALGTAPGWAVARLGCFFVHDHPGLKTDSFLAVDYPGGPRYDLGLFDMFALLALTGLLYALARKKRGTGLLMGLLASIYSVWRFSADFLRASDMSFVDRRYFGLTPAQYVVMGLLVVGVRLIVQSQRPESLTAKGSIP